MLTNTSFLWEPIYEQRFLIKYHLKMSYKKPTKREIKASLDYLKALAEKDFKPKDYEYIWTGDLTDKLT